MTRNLAATEANTGRRPRRYFLRGVIVLPSIRGSSSDNQPSAIRGTDLVHSAYAQYLIDESALGGGTADTVVFPVDTDQVEQILAQTQDDDRVTLSGGRTGLVGGAVPRGGTVLSLERMNRILSLDSNATGWSVTVQPGVTIRELSQALSLGSSGPLSGIAGRELLGEFDSAPHFYPVNPTEDTAHIGGTVSTNASGSRSLQYGVTRRYVRGLEVVLPSGNRLRIRRGQSLAERGWFSIRTGGGKLAVPALTYPRPDVKNAAGYYSAPDMDLIDLFIGAEGTLGVITEITLDLVPRPAGIFTGLAFFAAEDDAVAFVRAARGECNPCPVRPMSLELFDGRALRLLGSHRRDNPSAGYPAFPPGARAAILFEQGYADGELDDVCVRWADLMADHGSDPDTAWAGFNDPTAQAIIHARHALPEQVNAIIARNRVSCPAVHKVSTDMAVTPDRLTTLISMHRELFAAATGMDCVLYGHIGQNHLHANVLPTTEADLALARQLVHELAAKVTAIGGSPSVEHGCGRLKKGFLAMLAGEDGMRQMLAVKKTLDPSFTLNRGVLFGD